MLNEDKFQKFVVTKFRYCLDYQNSPLVFWLRAYWYRR